MGMYNYKQILEAVNRGIKFALSDLEDGETQSSISNLKHGLIEDSKSTRELLNLKKFVNLNLPSGTLWAKYNIGVDLMSDLTNAKNWIGNYYAWGETKPKEEYNYNTYLYHGNENATNIKDYYTNYVWPNNNNGTLKLIDDAAWVNTDGIYRMPSEQEFDELILYTTQTYVRHYNNIDGLNGWLFTSKNNDNELFFPETYWKADDSTYDFAVRMNYTCVAFYWSRTISAKDDCNMPTYLSLRKSSSKDFISTLSRQREFGMTVRGVFNKR